MQYIKGSVDDGMIALSGRLTEQLNAGKKILWLIPGGSNIPIAIEVMKTLRVDCTPSSLSNLSVMLSDERYGTIGHSDSNWQQLLDGGFDMSDIKATPVLCGLPIHETVKKWGEGLVKALDSNDLAIGQFGMGTDGHIAGIHPHSPAISDAGPTCAYEAGPFMRVTITIETIKKLNAAYLFVFGETKRSVVNNFIKFDREVDEEPAQILKTLPESYLYSDQLA